MMRDYSSHVYTGSIVFDLVGCFECGEDSWEFAVADVEEPFAKCVLRCRNCTAVTEFMHILFHQPLRTPTEFLSKEDQLFGFTRYGDRV